jgi:hypothetical protein
MTIPDFKKTLESWVWCISHNNLDQETFEDLEKTIRLALRIAERLQSGEVSEGMHKAAGEYNNRCAIENYGGCADAEGLYYAMAQQLIKECE